MTLHSERETNGPNKEIAQAIDELLASISGADNPWTTVAMVTTMGSFLIAPAAFLLIWLAIGMSWGMSLLLALGIFVCLWLIAVVAGWCGDAASGKAADRAADSFAERFPSGTDGRAEAVGLLAARIEKAAREIEEATSSHAVPEGNEGIVFLTTHFLASEPALITALGHRGIIPEEELRRLSGVLERSKQIWNQYCQDSKRAEAVHGGPATAVGESSAAEEKKVQCPVCGNVQREGEWEHKMDSKAKIQGLSGFVNLSAPPQCLKCEAHLDGSGQNGETPANVVSGVCDICNQTTSTDTGGEVFKNRQMKQATERGFNGMAVGRNAGMLAMVGMNGNETYSEWKRKVMLDTTDWLLCPDCQKEIRRYT